MKVGKRRRKEGKGSEGKKERRKDGRKEGVKEKGVR